MSVLITQPTTQPTTTGALEVDYSKRLMLVSGRSNPGLAAKIASKLGVELGGMRSRYAARTCSSCSRRAVTPTPA